MDQIKWFKNRISNTVQSLLLVALLASLLGLLGGLVGGRILSIVAIGVAILLCFIHPQASPYFVLKLHRSRRLGYHEAPQLHETVRLLSRRAGLDRAPDLF